jgi:hypothetical protein
MRQTQLLLVPVLLVLSVSASASAATSTVQNLLDNGAGKSGNVLPGLMHAPGIAKKLEPTQPPLPMATGTLTVAFDYSSPPDNTVIPGQTGVELARLEFTGTGEAIDLQQQRFM